MLLVFGLLLESSVLLSFLLPAGVGEGEGAAGEGAAEEGAAGEGAAEEGAAGEGAAGEGAAGEGAAGEGAAGEGAEGTVLIDVLGITGLLLLGSGLGCDVGCASTTGIGLIGSEGVGFAFGSAIIADFERSSTLLTFLFIT